MPEDLEPTNQYEPAKKFGNARKYDWERLLDGKPHIIRRGTDYNSTQRSMKATIYGEAKRRHLYVAMSNQEAVEAFVLQSYTDPAKRPLLPSYKSITAPIPDDAPKCRICQLPLLTPIAKANGECTSRTDPTNPRSNYQKDHERS